MGGLGFSVLVTLFVASRASGLPFLDAEIESAANDLGADLCIAGADGRRIADALSRKQYMTLWLAGHGDDNGIWLSDDCQISANALAPSVRDRGIKLIILNSCSSAQMAYELYSKTGARVVYTEAPVMDEAAFSTAKRFASEIAAGTDYDTAFDRSQSQFFRMVPNRGKRNMDSALLDEIRKALREIDRRLLILETKFDIFNNGNNNKQGDRMHWAIIIAGLLLAVALFLLLSGNELL